MARVSNAENKKINKVATAKTNAATITKPPIKPVKGPTYAAPPAKGVSGKGWASKAGVPKAGKSKGKAC